MDKREEQINKAGKKYGLKNPYNTYINNKVFNSNYEIPAKDFIEGAKWADKHPNWISVEDELPKDMLQPLCLVVTKGAVVVGFYYHDYKQWFATGYCNLKPIEVTHWMPFPKFIKKNENSYEENNSIVGGHYKHDFL